LDFLQNFLQSSKSKKGQKEDTFLKAFDAEITIK
jgi:hypothetical protein